MASGSLKYQKFILGNIKMEEDIEALKVSNTRIQEDIDTLQNPEFKEASTRSNINSGESNATILGKIKKYFTDIKSHAFNTPANNLTTTSTGYALDAYQGKVLSDRIDTLTPSKVTVSCTTNGDIFVPGDSKSISLPTTAGVYILGIRSLYDDSVNGICWVTNYWDGTGGQSGIICINGPLSISVTGKTLTITNALNTNIRIRDVQITINKIG